MPQPDFRSPRLFVDAALAPGETLGLERNQSNYLGNVLRLAAATRFWCSTGATANGGLLSPAANGPTVSRSGPNPAADRLPDIAYVFAP